MNAHSRSRPGFLLRQVRAHTRLLTSILVGVLITSAIPRDVVSKEITRILVGWNVSTWLYLLLVAIMMWRSTADTMRARAKSQDEGKTLLLILVIITAIASLAAIVAELLVVKNMVGFDRGAHVALVATTIVGSWAFTHTMFALHYAHDYYLSQPAGRDAGLLFPGTEHPDYGDFIYFAAIIGTSGQTADVSFTSQHMRRIGTAHCVLAFFFNTTVLAFTINIAASLF